MRDGESTELVCHLCCDIVVVNYNAPDFSTNYAENVEIVEDESCPCKDNLSGDELASYLERLLEDLQEQEEGEEQDWEDNKIEARLEEEAGF